SSGTLPGPNDDVVDDIPGVSNAVVFHWTGVDTVHSLTSTEPFELSGGTLNVTGTVQVQNTFTLDGGNLGGATLAAGTTLTGTRWGGGLDGVTLNGNLDLTNDGAANVSVAHGLVLNGTA